MIHRNSVKKIILLVLLIAVVQSAVPLVRAQPTPNVLVMAPYWHPLPVPLMPYAAGYFDAEHTTTTQVQITVSFPNTPPSGKTIQEVIPYDNYIAGGMFVQGQDSQLDRTDYGFLASLSLDHWGTLQYNMAFYVTFEFFPGDWYSCLWEDAVILGVSPSKQVTLTMQWIGDFVQWRYTIDGSTYLAASIYAPGYYSSTMHRCFHIGTVHRSPPAGFWGSWDAYYYQFGIYSKQIIYNSGWKVRLEKPKYYDASISKLRYVHRASGIEGCSSYLDLWWKWGGEFYEARASYYNSYYSPLPWKFLLEFDYDSDESTYLYDGQLLWDHPADAPETPSTPSGPSSGYRWTSYTYTTTTTDPNGNNVRYQFDWGDGSSTWTGYYASGATASASHSWNSIGAYVIRVRAKDTTGLYSDWSYYKKMNIINKPGNPCPTLFAWNGEEYDEVGVLDIHDDFDITFVQGIEPTLAAENHLYKLSLRELDEFTSHIDYVKLYAMDNDVKKHECHLAQAVHDELGHIERPLLRDDGKRVDLDPLRTIDLKFTVPNADEIAYFIFEINGYNRKPP